MSQLMLASGDNQQNLTVEDPLAWIKAVGDLLKWEFVYLESQSTTQSWHKMKYGH